MLIGMVSVMSGVRLESLACRIIREVKSHSVMGGHNVGVARHVVVGIDLADNALSTEGDVPCWRS